VGEDLNRVKREKPAAPWGGEGILKKTEIWGKGGKTFKSETERGFGGA